MNKDNMDKVHEQLLKMQKEEFLKDFNFPKEKTKRGLYVINVRKDGRRTQLSSKTIDGLKDKVIDFYNDSNRFSYHSFKSVFFRAVNEQLLYIKDNERLVSAENTKKRKEYAYDKYYSDTFIESRFVSDINKNDIEKIITLNIKRFDMRKKAFSNMLSVIRLVFSYSFEKEYINDNIFLRINTKKYETFLIKDVSLDKRVHTDKEFDIILNELKRYHKEKPDYIPAYALYLQMMTGMRRGEIPPLLWSDIKDGFIYITKEQITRQDKGHSVIIVNHTKTYKDRRFPITPKISEFLSILYARTGHSIYLFPSKDGCIGNYAVYELYRRICKKHDILLSRDFIKGTHSFRRNAITDAINNTDGNIELVAEIFGNSPDVSRKNYFLGFDKKKSYEAMIKRDDLF